MSAQQDSVRLILLVATSLAGVVVFVWTVTSLLRFSVRVVCGNRPTFGSCLATLILSGLASLPVAFAFDLAGRFTNPAAAPALIGANLLAGLLVQSAILAAMAGDHRGRIATFRQACGASLLHSALLLGIFFAAALGAALAFPAHAETVLEVAKRQGLRQMMRQSVAENPEAAQRAAVRKYPALGVSASRFNIEFLRRHAEYQREKPDYFRDPAWPLRLADEVAAAGF